MLLRPAVSADAGALVPWILDFNQLEGIAVDADGLRVALDRLLTDAALGRAWWIDEAGAPAGYAIVTFGYDLEFLGRDAFLTDFYLMPAARGRGLGGRALDAVLAALPALDVRALHLGVRRDNAPALALYRR